MKKLNLIKKTGCCSDVIDINEDDLIDDFNDFVDRDEIPDVFIKRCGVFKGKALVLDGSYDYVVGKEEGGNIILVPLKKK